MWILSLLIQVIILLLIGYSQVEAQGIQILTTTNPALNNPYGVGVDSSNNVYVADANNHRVVRFASNGPVIQILTTTSPFFLPSGVALDSSNNVYVADANNARIVKFAPNGTVISFWTTTNFQLAGVAVDDSNNVYVADQYNNRIVKFSPNGTQIQTLTTTNPSLFDPVGVAVDPSYNVYVADQYNNRIVKFSPNGTVIQTLTTTNPSLFDPVGVAVDPSYDVYVTDSGNNRIVKFSPNGTFISNLTTSNPSLSYPLGVTFDGSNNVYVTDAENNRIVIFYYQLCPLGYYCPGLTSTAILCPAGYYCPSQYLYAPNVTLCPSGVPCPAGTSALVSSYSSSTGTLHSSSSTGTTPSSSSSLAASTGPGSSSSTIGTSSSSVMSSPGTSANSTSSSSSSISLSAHSAGSSSPSSSTTGTSFSSLSPVPSVCTSLGDLNPADFPFSASAGQFQAGLLIFNAISIPPINPQAVAAGALSVASLSIRLLANTGTFNLRLGLYQYTRGPTAGQNDTVILLMPTVQQQLVNPAAGLYTFYPDLTLNPQGVYLLPLTTYAVAVWSNTPFYANFIPHYNAIFTLAYNTSIPFPSNLTFSSGAYGQLPSGINVCSSPSAASYLGSVVRTGVDTIAAQSNCISNSGGVNCITTTGWGSIVVLVPISLASYGITQPVYITQIVFPQAFYGPGISQPNSHTRLAVYRINNFPGTNPTLLAEGTSELVYSYTTEYTYGTQNVQTATLTSPVLVNPSVDSIGLAYWCDYCYEQYNCNLGTPNYFYSRTYTPGVSNFTTTSSLTNPSGNICVMDLYFIASTVSLLPSGSSSLSSTRSSSSTGTAVTGTTPSSSSSLAALTGVSLSSTGLGSASSSSSSRILSPSSSSPGNTSAAGVSSSGTGISSLCNLSTTLPMVNLTISALSGATAAAVVLGYTNHYDTPTGIYVSPGDILQYFSNSTSSSWCYYCSNAAGSGQEFYAGHQVQALVFRYGNATADPNNSDWYSVFAYVTPAVSPQLATWVVPNTTVSNSQIWLATWDGDLTDNSGQVTVGIQRTVAGTCTAASSSSAFSSSTGVLVLSSSSTARSPASSTQSSSVSSSAGTSSSTGVRAVSSTAVSASSSSSGGSGSVSSTLASSSSGVTSPRPSYAPSSAATCVSLLTPNLTVGTSAYVYLTDPCQLASTTLAELEMYEIAPVCRFTPSQFQSPGTILLNTTQGSNTDVTQTVIVCPFPTSMSVGTYLVQLSLDGDVSFDVPEVNADTIGASMLTVAADNYQNSTQTGFSSLNVSAISLQHTYDTTIDVYPRGFNPEDMQLITWQTPQGAPSYLTLLLLIAFMEWESTSTTYQSPTIIQPCYVIANNIYTNQSSYLWVVPNMTVVLSELNLNPAYIVEFSIGGYYTSTNSLIPNNGNIIGRRLLDFSLLNLLLTIYSVITSTYVFFPKDAEKIGDAIKAYTTKAIDYINTDETEAAKIEIQEAMEALQDSAANLEVDIEFAETATELVEAAELAALLGVGAGLVLTVLLAAGLYYAYTHLYGDVHISTLDGVHYDFQAVGVYWLLLANLPLYTQFNTTGFAMQIHLQPLTHFFQPGSSEALNYRGVTYMAGIGLQADGSCGIINIIPRTTISPVTHTYLDIYDAGVYVNIPYIQPPASIYASSINYPLSCATIYLPSPDTVVITTYNNYIITATAYDGTGRFSNLAVSVPLTAFDHTQGLAGSWDGNSTNDFIDAGGHDWLQTYPGNVDSISINAGSAGPNDPAGYAFGQTWTVQPEESLFVNVGPPEIGCNITEDDSAEFTLGCLFGGGTNATNLLLYEVNVTSVLQNFSISMLPTLPAVWPNPTLQAEAIATCEAIIGTSNLSNILVQNCLIDVYDFNSTTGAVATQIFIAQTVIAAVELPVLNLTNLSPSQAIISVNATASIQTHGGHCTTLLLVPSSSNLLTNQTQCSYVAQYGTTSYLPLNVSTVLVSVNSEASILALQISSLVAGTTYNLRVAFLVTTSTLPNGTQTSWVTLSFTTPVNTANLTASMSSSSSSTGSSLASSTGTAMLSSTGFVASTGISMVTSGGGVSRAVGDPQLIGFRGQSFQVHGIDGAVYNLISSPRLQLNARFGFLTGPRGCPVMPSTRQRAVACWSHPGSYLTEVGLQVLSSNQILYQILLRPGFAVQGLATIKYQDRRLDPSLGLGIKVEGLELQILSTHEVRVVVEDFTIEIENIDGFVNLRSIGVHRELSNLGSHGLIGQTWQTTTYPGKHKYTEGQIDDYVLEENDVMGVDFVYNQFGTESITPQEQ